MLFLVARKLATAILTLFLVTVLVFGLIHLAPGDPISESADSSYRPLPPETVEELRRLYHLDQPLVRQYGLWLRDVLRGDLGRSTHDRRPVTERIAERLGPSVLLNTFSLTLMVLVALPLGAAAALQPGSVWDRLAAASTNLLFAVPVFWAGLLLQDLFAGRLGWLPPYGLASRGIESSGLVHRWLDLGVHLILPVACLSYGGLAYLSRFVRATLLETGSGEQRLAARARGLSNVAVLYRHGFRLAALPMLTLAGFLLPGLVGGSVVVEKIFAIPGLGDLFVDAAFQRDYPVLMGLTLLSGSATLVGIVVADLAYTFADPRVRRG